MTTSKDQVRKHGKNQVNGDGDIMTGEDTYQGIQPKLQRAAHLHNLYNAFKGSYEGIRFRRKTKNTAIISVFRKVANKLDEEERWTGEEIEDRLFVLALFLRYGKNTYPGHLLGDKAIDMYYELLERLCRTVYRPKKDADDELLKYLCEVRGESEQEVMYALEGARVFSPTFIKKWKKVHSQEMPDRGPTRSRQR